MGDDVLPESVRRAIAHRPSSASDSRTGRLRQNLEKARAVRTPRKRYEPPWPVDIPQGRWYDVYPKCLRPNYDGEFLCKTRPATRGNFYCAKHGGLHHQTVRKAKERYIYWCMAGEPFLNPDIFDEFMVIWLKRLGDHIMKMPVSKQLRFLEIAAELLKERNGDSDKAE